MQVTKLTSLVETSVLDVHQLSEKQLFDEINCRRSEKTDKKDACRWLYYTPDECD